ncbi:MAG: hypothetical protein IPH78_10305 [Bacteroidetes bacterium]|nr:hypothetical protein [Bacteroidota bacterium]MBK8658882.1 hypothetical protein [Bacteroidota bacterium]
MPQEKKHLLQEKMYLLQEKINMLQEKKMAAQSLPNGIQCLYRATLLL